ncbi:c-type cytochrome [Stappia stellulata]|uniref:c-type cytochrome n=1 Tax=Stappia stellulata TaxID=71235 RepID=UPI0003FE746E|nr:cytochrome C [Stappia stellulata]
MFLPLVGAVVLTACVVGVSVWALARPEADPIGAWFRALGARTASYADSLQTPTGAGRTDWTDQALRVVDGDPARGADLIADFGCGACHAIPGVVRARGTVGPDLRGFRDRSYIAGILPNRPGNLVDWLQSPPRHSPKTVMPDMGVSENEARHMAAYLYMMESR